MIVYDNLNQKYLVSESKDSKSLLLNTFDDGGTCATSAEISSIVSDSLEQQKPIDSSQISESRHHELTPVWHEQTDNVPMLKFEHIPEQSSKAKMIAVSDCGMQVSVLKNAQKDTKKFIEMHSVLTNMTFSTGVHVWEIICPISCHNIFVGVYNPLTQTYLMETFYNTSPRSIFICLDLDKQVIKFWLNEQHLPQKTIDMVKKAAQGEAGQGHLWIPAIKIGREGNHAILNPFPYKPFYFRDDISIRCFNQNSLLLPHIVDVVCVSNFSKDFSGSVDDVLQKLSITKKEVARISIYGSVENTVCFVKFNNINSMKLFANQNWAQIKKIFGYLQSFDKEDTQTLSQPDLTILLPNGIYKLFKCQDQIKDNSKFSKLKKPIALFMDELLTTKEATIQQAKTSVENAFQILSDQPIQKAQCKDQITDFKLIQQPFSDKLICIKNQTQVQIIERCQITQNLNIDKTTHFIKSPTQIDQIISLRILEKQITSFFKFTTWDTIFKDNQSKGLFFGIITSLFEDIKTTARLHQIPDGNFIQFSVKLSEISLFIQIALKHLEIENERYSRDVQNLKNKMRNRQDENQNFKMNFQDGKVPSIDELNIAQNVLQDLSEQIWCLSISSQCSESVQNYCTQVSRPYSALSRLGSFCNFKLSDNSDEGSIKDLAKLGFIYKQSNQLGHSQSGNSKVQIENLSYSQIKDKEVQNKLFGNSNRMFEGLITPDIQLKNSLGYMSPYTSGPINQVLVSQNNQFVLVVKQEGQLELHSTDLNLNKIAQIQMFQCDEKNEISNNPFLKQVEILNNQLKSDWDNIFKQQLKQSHSVTMLKQTLEDNTNKNTQEKNDQIKADKKTKSSVQGLKNQPEEATELYDGLLLQGLFDEQDQDDENENQLGTTNNQDQDKQEQVNQKETTPEQLKDIKIIGYQLLTEPAHNKVLDPITIGCIYQRKSTQKMFLKVKKLAYNPQYLMKFLQTDPASGLLQNKLTDKYYTQNICQQSNQIVDIFCQLIDEHHDQIIGFNSLFQQVNDSSDTQDMFIENTSSEIEIQNCSEIVDFTQSCFSILDQNTVSVLIESASSKEKYLRQYSVKSIEDKKQNLSQWTPKNIQIENAIDIKIEMNKQFVKIFQFENQLVTVATDGIRVFDSKTGSQLTDSEFTHKISDINSVQIINKTPLNQLYHKNNLRPQQQQTWTLVYKSMDRIVSHSLVQEQQQDKNKKQLELVQQGILEMSENQLSEIQNSIKQVNLSYQAHLIQNSQFFQQHGFGVDKTQQSFTILPCSSKNDDDIEVNLKINEESGNENIRATQIKVCQYLAVKDISKVSQLLKIPDKTEFKDQDIRIQIDKNSKVLPLVLEQFKGAQTNELHKPSLITAGNSSIFCSNYPEPEYIFRHQHGLRFILHGYSIKSEYNRQGWGIPIGRGYIFASEHLEDIGAKTKRFMNKLKLYQKEWEPSDTYIPSEPIGKFEMGKDMLMTFEVDPQYRRTYRFIKLVPFEFRHAPINYSRIPFNSKPSEMSYFGIHGQELDDMNQLVPIQPMQQQTSIQLAKIASLDIGGNIVENYDCCKTTIQLQAGSSFSEQGVQTILSKQNIHQYTPIIKIPISFQIDLPNSNSIIKLTIPQKKLNELGLEMSSFSIQIQGFVNNHKYQKFTKDALSIFNNSLTPIINELTSNKIGVFHIQLLKNTLINLKLNNRDEFVSLLAKIDSNILDMILKQSLNLHKTEQLELLSLLKALFSETDIQERYQQQISNFVIDSLDNLCKRKWRKSSIDFVLGLSYTFLQSAELQANIMNKLVDIVTVSICENSMFKNLEYYKKYQIIKQIEPNYDDILDGDISFYDVKKQHRNDIVPDVYDAPKGLLIKQQVTKFCKFNNIQQYDIDFQTAFRVSKIKLQLLNELDFQKLQNHKLRVIVSIPQSCNGQVSKKVIFNQIFDENQFYQLSEASAPIDNKGNSYENKLTVDLGRRGWLNTKQGILTRYLSVQIQILQVKGAKDQTNSNYDYCIFPQAFGLSTIEQAQQIEKLNIKQPEGDQIAAVVCFDQKNNLIYNIGQYNLSLDANLNELFHNRAAIFSLRDESKVIEDQEQFETSQLHLQALKQQIEKNVDLNSVKEFIHEIVSGFKVIKQNYICYFQMNTALTYDYLLNLQEMLCNVILCHIKDNGMGQDQQPKYKQMLNGLISQMMNQIQIEQIDTETLETQQSNVKSLMEFILLNIDDHYQFYCDLLNKYVFQKQKQTEKDKASSSLVVQKFLLLKAKSNLNEILKLYELQFDCLPKEQHKVNSIQQIYEKLMPSKTERNHKQSLSMILQVFNLINSIVNGSRKIGMDTQFEVDISHIFNLIAQHLLFCPKVKFAPFYNQSEKKYKNSIKMTNKLIVTGLECIKVLLQSNNVTTKLDLAQNKTELRTLILTILLIEDQNQRKIAIKHFMQIAKYDSDIVVIQVIDELMQAQTQIYNGRSQANKLYDVIDIIRLQLEQAKKLTIHISQLSNDKPAQIQAVNQHKLTIQSIKKVVKDVLTQVNNNQGQTTINQENKINQWLKLFEVVAQTSFLSLSQNYENSEEESLQQISAQHNIIQEFHYQFLNQQKSIETSQKQRIFQEGFQLQVFPNFVSILQSELYQAIKLQGNYMKNKVVNVIIEILDILINYPGEDFHSIQFEYSYALIQILQSDGTKVSESILPMTSMYQLEEINLTKEKARLQKVQSIIKTKISQSNLKKLVQIFTNYIQNKIIQSFKFYDKDNSLQSMQKLTIANQILAIIEWSEDNKKSLAISKKLHLNAYQLLIMDDNLDEKYLSNYVETIFDWLLSFNDSHDSMNKNKLVCDQARKFQSNLMSLLMKAAPHESVFNIDEINKEGRARCLNIFIRVLLQKIQTNENYTMSQLEHQTASFTQVIKNQENSNKILMFFFKKWIVNDEVAQSFLRDHNGLNFILNRLLIKQQNDTSTNKQPTPKKEQNQQKSEIVVPEEISSDEANFSDSEQNTSLPQAPSEKPFIVNQGKDKISDSQMKYFTTSLKDQELSSIIELVYTDDKRTMTSNSNGYDGSFKLSLSRNSIVAKEFKMIFQIKGLKSVNLRKLNFAVTHQFSNQQLNMKDIQLFIVAEGGMSHKNGEVSDVQWQVPLQFRPHDQQLYNYYGSNIQSYGFDFDQLEHNDQNELDQKDFEESNSQIKSKFVNKAKFIKLTVRHPQIALKEIQQMFNFTSSQMTYAYQFISCVGCATVDSTQVQKQLVQSKKDSSMEMLSQFFQAEFSETFKQISKNPETVAQFKVLFSMISELLIMKEELIKPIFLSMCQDNDELCSWVIQNQLLNQNLLSTTIQQISVLGELIRTQKDPKQYMNKLVVLRNYLFNTVHESIEDDIDYSLVLIKIQKLFTTLVTCIREFQNQYPDFKENQIIEFSDSNLLDLVKFMNKLSKINDYMEVQKPIMKLLAILLKCPSPFKNSGNLTLEKAAKLVLDYIVNENCKNWKDDTKLDKLFMNISISWPSQILTSLAGYSSSVYNLIRSVDIQGQKVDLIQVIIDVLVSKNKSKISSQNEKHAKDKELDKPQEKEITFADMFAEPDEINQQVEQQIVDQNKFSYEILIQHLYKLSNNSSFYEDYGQDLAMDLYLYTIRNEPKEFCTVQVSKLLDNESVEILVGIICKLVMQSNEKEKQSLQRILSLIQKDLTNATNLDPDFIKNVVVPLLHTQEKTYFRLNFQLNQQPQSQNQNENQQQTRMPIFWSQQGQTDLDNNNNFKPGKVNKYGSRPFFMNTELLTDKMKENFEKAFVDYRKDSLPEVAEMVKSEWQLLYKQTKEDKGNAGHAQSKQYWLNNGFKEMVEQCQDKTNFFILCKGRQTVTTSGLNFQGEDVTIGCFSHNTFPQNVTSNWKHYSNYTIQHSTNNIFFIYSNSKMLHFEPRKNQSSNPAGHLYTDGTNGGALIVHNNFLAISWSVDYRHMFGDMNYVSQLDSHKETLRSQDFEPIEIQIWHYVPGIKLKQNQNLRKMFKMMPTYQRSLPHNLFSNNLIFQECLTKKMGMILDEYLDSKQYIIANEEIENKQETDEKGDPKVNSMTLGDLKQAVVKKGQSNFIIDIDIKAIEQSKQSEDQEQLKKDDPKQQKDKLKEEKYVHKPYFPILNKLEQDGGIVDLINVALAVVNSYHSEKSRGTWSLWLQEIKSFIELPNFFTYFSQDYNKSQTIYQLIARNYDIDKSVKKEQVEVLNKKYEKMYTEHVNYIYKIINEVFSKHTDSSLKKTCIQNGTYSKFLDRLGQLTGEKKRSKINTENLAVPQNNQDQNDSQSQKSNSEQKTKEKDSGASKKKKGVGYGGGSTTWNVAEYLQTQEAKYEQITMILGIIIQSIREKPESQKDDSQIDSGSSNQIDMKDIILESALLPILESAMRSGSLLEMAKQAQLYNVYLDLIVEMANNQKYITLLDKISNQYVPEQKKSIQLLLEQVAGQSNIFLNALSGKNQVSSSGKESEDDKKSKELAERIVKTEEIVKSKMKETLRKEHSLKLQSLASLPLSHAYTELLAPLRFAYMSMKKNIGDKAYEHMYSNDVQNNPNPSQSKIIRLAQEIADLSNSLPCEPSNAMFCRVEKGRVDLMKIMIMGASGTPYAHGAFVYDLFFPDTYPNNAPKCLLVTTGGGQVRFNPNLYNQGKVCLSLLGTWGGSNTETWDPKLSTILQLVMSIQAIIMSNEVYFNEPGYEHEMSTPAGEKKNTGYSNIVKYCNVKFAIIEAIKNPPKGFEKVIRRNFYLKKQMILDEVKEWCSQATNEAGAVYSGLVSSHNNNWASKLQQPGAYKKMMDQIYQELEQTLKSLKNPFDDDEDDVQEDVKKAIEKIDNNSKPEDKQKGKLNVKGENLEDIDVSYKQPKDNLQNDQKIDIQDEKVKDRWSRYIGAMGIEAVAKQAESRVLICDMGALSVEIAKNIVLAGCKELVIFEKQYPQGLTVKANIASGQFFLSDKDKEQSPALQSKHKLQELNHYVKVTVIKDKKYTSVVDYLKAQKAEKAEPFKAVVHTEFYTNDHSHLIQEIIQSNEFCRSENIPFIWCYVAGCTARVFTDFGPKFKILETSSEEIPDVMINSIQRIDDQKKQKRALVTLIDGQIHQFQEGDKIKFEEVIGMQIKQKDSTDTTQIDSSASSSKQSSVNNQELTVSKVINKQKFEVEIDMDMYSDYKESGIVKYQKTPKIVENKSLQQYLQQYSNILDQVSAKGPEQFSFDQVLDEQGKAGFFDENLIMADFDKMLEIQLTDFLITGKIDFRPIDEDSDDSDHQSLTQQQEKIYEQILQKENKIEDKQKLANTIFKILLMHNEYLNVYLAPLAAFMGGVVAQEIVKAMTFKFIPIKQVAYISCSELIEDAKFIQKNNFEKRFLQKLFEEIDERTNIAEDSLSEQEISQITLLGKNLHNKIKNTKLFMIGAGAIGCELLKNYAMLGVGTGDNGHIILTDPDVIEVSNLNRQFLFREQHLRKPKSSTAAAAAIQMNNNLKGHIFARLDKIHDETADIYSEEFYETQTIITNALDNVKARLYIDAKCVQARVPMIDSGTLGTKGHVQVVIPFKTESYASQKDPEQTNEIPYCTLKMFPEETLHCVEWAKDLFDNWFTLDSQSFNKFLLADLEQQDLGNSQTKEIAKKFIKMHTKRPSSFKDCIEKARKKFQSLFHNNILQLLHTYPLDKKNADGRPFWSLPKRPPKNIEFDENNQVHATFVSAYACLLAGMYKIDIKKEIEFEDVAKNPRSEQSRNKIAKYAGTLKAKPFVPNDEKAKLIEAEVQKATTNGNDDQNGKDTAEESQQTSLAEDDQKEVEDIIKQIEAARLKMFGESSLVKVTEKVQQNAQLKVEEFEKDEDDNFHIDIIYAMANIRAQNYSLQSMEWITVKIKAGRIVPALATTTAAIAGLQTIEMLKIIKGTPIENQKNSFLNLAVPSLMMGEPGPPEKFKLTEELSVNLWDRWEYKQATPKTTLIDVIRHVDKLHDKKLEFRDVFQAAKPLFIYSLGLTNMKLQKLSKIEECPELNKSILELTGTSPKEIEIQKFMDLTITFTAKKSEGTDTNEGEYEILKNVPDIRVYFTPEISSSQENNQ